MSDFIILGISIGSLVFLLHKTDFIFEYSSFFIRILGLSSFFKLDHYKNNKTIDCESYFEFICFINATNKGFFGFICRLLSCGICLNCFLSLFLCSFLFLKSFLFLFVFFCAIISYFFLIKLKQNMYK
jgi:hypothetical protein